MSGRKVINGVGVLGAEHLIPFKMRAWLDLCRRKSEGEHMNSADIKKHKNDVFRLMNVINPDEVISTPETVKDDVRQFIAGIRSDNSFCVPAIFMPISKILSQNFTFLFL